MLHKIDPLRDALFLDIDGTLLDIAPRPEDVAVPPTLVDDLGRLQHKLGGALAFISGRPILEADRLFAPLRLCGAGAHGAEWRLSPGGEVEAGPSLSHELRDELAAAFADLDGVIVEDKIYGVAVHYRRAPRKGGEAGRRVMALAEKRGKEIKIIHGRKVLEVVPSSNDKGTALERLMAVAPFKGRRPVFLGDDTTDLAAIAVCLKKGGLAARVGHGASRRNAFASPATVRAWIHEIAA